MIDLQNLSVVSIDVMDIPEEIKALRKYSQAVKFGDEVLDKRKFNKFLEDALNNEFLGSPNNLETRNRMVDFIQYNTYNVYHYDVALKIVGRITRENN